MATQENYNKYVLEDINNHFGLIYTVKAPLVQRISIRNINIMDVHPNPEDEFAIKKIGPNWGIVNNYETDIRRRIGRSQQVFEEPLTVVKLNKDGYMLLNGHHRWLAAINVGVKKVPVKVINLTTSEDVTKIVDKSTRDKCVTIDLDEVLISSEAMKFPFNLIYKESLRKKASLLISELHRQGFDIWVYTGTYKSDSYIKGLFSLNNCKIDGVVNGINGKRKNINLKDLFRKKYNLIVHVDNNMVSFVNTVTKKFETIDIDANKESWASVSAQIIKNENPFIEE